MYDTQPVMPVRVSHWTDRLRLDSTIAELKLNLSEIDVSLPGKQLLKLFSHDDHLPGVILLRDGEFVGLVSREYFLEMMSLPYRMDLFAQRPIEQLYEFVNVNLLKLDGSTSILDAAKQALDRPPNSVYEPIVVELVDRAYRLLDVRRLLVAQSKLYEVATIALRQREAEILDLNQRLKAENTRLGAEVEVTRKIQTMLLPHNAELAAISSLDIAAYMEPAAEVGGDYYDILRHHDRVKIGIGDVTGHGLESGVLMLMVQTAVRTLLTHDVTDPVAFFSTLNQTIFDNVGRMESDKHLTLALLDYTDQDGYGHVTLSGQHEDVIVLRRDGTIETIDTVDLGFPIGLDEMIAPFIGQTSLELASGEAIVLYTDGITEAENTEGQMYGFERFLEVLKRHAHGCADDIRQAVITDVKTFIGLNTIYDDITLLVLKQR
jgi:serine phosphatase RsbU (regulator of sigma subunit)